MKPAVRRLQVLHGHEQPAVEGRDEEDAGIGRAIADAVAVEIAQDHGAGAAVAFGAAFLGAGEAPAAKPLQDGRSEEHTSELQSLMRSSYAVFCLKKNRRSTNDLQRRN